MICVRCGQQNPDGVKFCQSCNAILPKISESVATPLSPRISNHYNQLQDACQQVRAGQWSMDQFQNVLDQIYAIISERAQEIESLEIPEAIRPRLQEQLDMGFSGIYDFLEGIQELRLYLEDSNEEHLDIGLELAERGNESLNSALDMARSNIRRLKESDPDNFDPIA